MESPSPAATRPDQHRPKVGAAMRIAGAAVLLLLAPLVAGLAASGTGERSSGALAAIFPPWIEPDAAFVTAASAATEVLRVGGWPWIVVVRSGPGTAAALRDGGAMLVVDAALTAGCGA